MIKITNYIIRGKMRFIRVLKSPYTIVLIMIIIFLLSFSFSTSPLYIGNHENDSSIFILMGKALVNGKRLYTDIFDHKGPILFFIEALGQLVQEGKTGIFLIQIILLYLSFIFVYKVINLFCNKKYSMFSTVVSLCILSYFFVGGNTSEELSLLFISLPLYLCFKWLKSDTTLENIPKFNTLVYGICFTIIAFIKLYNAISLCGMILGITIILIKNKKIKELFKHMGIFIMGISIIAIPIIIYFSCRNSLYDMLYGTFIHNFLYINAKLEFNSNILIKTINISHLFFSLIVSFMYIKKEKNISMVCVFIILTTIILSYVGFGIYHYYIITIPIFSVALGMFFKYIEILNLSKDLKIIVILIIFFVCMAYSLPKFVNNVCILLDKDYIRLETITKKLVDNIPDKENIVFYQISSCCYLYINTVPEYKYAFYQQHLILSNARIKDEIIKDLNNGNIKYILIIDNNEIDIDIYNSINKHYTELNKLEGFINQDQKTNLVLYEYNEKTF